MSVLEAPYETAAPEATSDNKVKLIALAVVGVILLAAAAFFVPKLLSGGEDPAPPIKKAAGAVSAGKDGDSATVPPVKKKAPAKSTLVRVKARDPFKPLYTEPSAAAGPAAPAPAGAAAPGTAAAAPGAVVTNPGVLAPAGSASAAPAPVAPPAGGTGVTTPATTSKVSLVSVATTGGKLRAGTNVNGVLYTPAAGDTFGKVYKLVAVNGSCATYLLGDQKFGLCVGQYIVH